MKKILTSLISASIALTSVAQLNVATNGQVMVGDIEKANVMSETADTTSTLRLLGNGTNGTGATIAFGALGSTYITETISSIYTKPSFSSLVLSTKGGFGISAGGSEIMSYNPSIYIVSAQTNPISFSKTVSAPQYLTTSDSRQKTDIEPLDNLGSRLGEIAPISYYLIDESEGESSTPENGPKRSAGQSENTTNHQYGFLAQDVREVYPELVYEDEDGMLSIDYTGFIAILVDAVQTLQAKVKTQDQLIALLQNPQPQSATTGEGSVVASLSQNRPNPFRVSATISCVIPEEVSTAFICVYDLNGGQKLRRDISERGEVDITIDGNTLNAGMYIYTLVCDGIEIDSKRMILTD